MNLRFLEKQAALIMAQYSLKEEQNLVNAFQNNSTSKRSIHLKIILNIIKLIDTGINLTQAQQIIIVDLKNILYRKEQVEEKITRIG